MQYSEWDYVLFAKSHDVPYEKEAADERFCTRPFQSQ